jgi:hypothetical protein
VAVYLKWASLAVAAFAMAMHFASFFVPVNQSPVQIGLAVCAIVLAIGAFLAFPRGETVVHGTTYVTVSLKDSALRYVPRWMKVPPTLLAVYLTVGWALESQGVHLLGAPDASSWKARWACVFFAGVLLTSAAMYHGAAKIREREVL